MGARVSTKAVASIAIDLVNAVAPVFTGQAQALVDI